MPDFGCGQPAKVGEGQWRTDFTFRQGRVQVKKTGADLKLDGVLIAECLLWFAYHLMVLSVAGWRRLRHPPGPRIWFEPDTPRPWYLIRAAMTWGGFRLARSPQEADARFYFDDSTWGGLPADGLLNGRCRDVSKSHVAAVFEQVFGYPLALDPQTWVGPAVEKGELNGAHDGRVVQCPTAPQPGRCYQKLVDTAEGDFIHDLRTPTVGGVPVVVWEKKKPGDNRFSIHNLSVKRHDPRDVYSPEELALIARFCAAMGLDWGGLDILRDRPSGRIYIVDVNKTDVGPVIALSWADKLVSTGMLARALGRLVGVR
ncbi:hypothetical protein QO010_003337 [Caulobacter ginsengisoli]|uniref:ATP-grasp domain-containing protein n=1 Tax=Caulobacter ginsengisoli TaxID=400775 RepID=A0ABU0IU61_9CAUL|nr:hypothetical protein [Caulobacter ginsengisoli]MDQ0465548.1 hypothetical protein [Caulobacter ginsengisoli]